MNFYRINLEKWDNQIRELNDKRKILEDEKNAINTIIVKKNKTLNEITRKVTISLCARSEGELNLQLSYLVTGASWTSSYDCRIDYGDGKKNCVLNYFGSIINTTGEDWMKTKASLSTANPSLGGAPPILFPCLVSYNVPRPVFHGRKDNKKSKKSKDDKNESQMKSMSIQRRLSIDMPPPPVEEMLMPEMERVVTESVSNQGTSVSYMIKQLVSIESDNKPHKVTIAEVPLAVEFDYLIIPALTEDAYLRSQSKNDSDFQLLEGPMHVFINNVYVTQSRLNTVNPNEKFTMYLGIDRAIKVRVKPAKNLDSKQGVFFGKKNVQEVKKAIVVTNLKDEEVNISVYQQLPFSKDETIKIKIVKPAENDKNTRKDEFSIIEWKYTLEPGKSQNIVLEYSIESAPDKEVGFEVQDSFTKTSY